MNEEKRCEIHGSLLECKRVPVQYGLPIRNASFDEARIKLFPNSRSSVLGGCMDGLIGNYSEEFVCNECREAENKWRQEHKDERDSIRSSLQELFKVGPRSEKEQKASGDNLM